MSTTAPATAPQPASANTETSTAPAAPEVAPIAAPQSLAANDASAASPVVNDASFAAAQNEQSSVDAARQAPKPPEAQSTAAVTTDTPIMPTETKLPGHKPVVHVVAAPNTEAANDPLATIVKEVEAEAAVKIGTRIAELNSKGAQIDTTGLAVNVEITRTGKVAAATSHVCAPKCSHCSAQKETASETQTQADAAAPQALTPIVLPTATKPAELPKPEIKAEAVAEAPATTPLAEQPVGESIPSTVQAPTLTVTPPGIAAGKIVANEAHAKGAA